MEQTNKKKKKKQQQKENSFFDLKVFQSIVFPYSLFLLLVCPCLWSSLLLLKVFVLISAQVLWYDFFSSFSCRMWYPNPNDSKSPTVLNPQIGIGLLIDSVGVLCIIWSPWADRLRCYITCPKIDWTWTDYTPIKILILMWSKEVMWWYIVRFTWFGFFFFFLVFWRFSFWILVWVWLGLTFGVLSFGFAPIFYDFQDKVVKESR